MTDTFTASNGYRIGGWDKVAGLEVRNATDAPVHGLGKYAVDALREYFQAKEDERLGRVTYGDFSVLHVAEHTVRVIDNLTGESRRYARSQMERLEPGVSSEMGRAASRYFEAHPESKKPWHDAKAGEVWAITLDTGEQFAGVVHTDAGFPRFVNVADDMSYGPRAGITAGRRLFPTEATE